MEGIARRTCGRRQPRPPGLLIYALEYPKRVCVLAPRVGLAGAVVGAHLHEGACHVRKVLLSIAAAFSQGHGQCHALPCCGTLRYGRAPLGAERRAARVDEERAEEHLPYMEGAAPPHRGRGGSSIDR